MVASFMCFFLAKVHYHELFNQIFSYHDKPHRSRENIIFSYFSGKFYNYIYLFQALIGILSEWENLKTV